MKNKLDQRPEFRDQFFFCWSCGIGHDEQQLYRRWTQIDYFRHLECNHIIRGAGRSHDRRNLSMLCRLCHDLYHRAMIKHKGLYLPHLSLPNLLWLKAHHDVLDRTFLQTLQPRKLPRKRRPDDFFVDQYRRKFRCGYPQRVRLSDSRGT